MSITIVDYGMGNLHSIANMLKKCGAHAVISSDPDVIADAQKLILPGVGAFDGGMKNLVERALRQPLDHAVRERNVPVLGLCLGMQLMSCASEEGSEGGLGWIDANTIRLRIEDTNTKIPHMGWNTMRIAKRSWLTDTLPEDARFYFVHSYHLLCNDQSDVLGLTEYGYEFVSAVQRDNVLGVQFHPEKSHRFGMQLLKNFAESVQPSLVGIG